MAQLHYQALLCDSVAYLMSDHMSDGLLLPSAQTVFDAGGQRVKVIPDLTQMGVCIYDTRSYQLSVASSDDIQHMLVIFSRQISFDVTS